VSGPSYPPEDHVLRDLRFELEVVAPGRQVARLQCDDTTSLGSVATVLDVLGGALCASVVAPDWMATSTLTLRVGALPDTGVLEMSAEVLRAGRRSVTIEVVLRRAGTTGRVGDATLSFARLVRRESNLDLSGEAVEVGRRVAFERLLDGDAPAFDAAVGTAVAAAAAGTSTVTELRPYVLNSFGALNGGVVAAVAIATARQWAISRPDPLDPTHDRFVDRAAPGGLVVDEVAVHHLGQGRSGPVRGTAREVTGDGAPAGRHVVRVELVDTGVDDEGGRDGRLMAIAHVNLSVVQPQV
jgi:acyl-coenzyme A thioesterase PaaI-like protein